MKAIRLINYITGHRVTKPLDSEYRVALNYNVLVVFSPNSPVVDEPFAWAMFDSNEQRWFLLDGDGDYRREDGNYTDVEFVP